MWFWKLWNLFNKWKTPKQIGEKDELSKTLGEDLELKGKSTTIPSNSFNNWSVLEVHVSWQKIMDIKLSNVKWECYEVNLDYTTHILEKWEVKSFGRKGDILIDNEKKHTSRNHWKIKVDEDGNLVITDWVEQWQWSTNGTTLKFIQKVEENKTQISKEPFNLDENNKEFKVELSNDNMIFFKVDSRQYYIFEKDGVYKIKFDLLESSNPNNAVIMTEEILPGNAKEYDFNGKFPFNVSINWESISIQVKDWKNIKWDVVGNPWNS